LTDLDADLSLLFFFGFLFCHAAFTGMSVHVQYAGSDVGRGAAIWRSPKYIMPVIWQPNIHLNTA